MIPCSFRLGIFVMDSSDMSDHASAVDSDVVPDVTTADAPTARPSHDGRPRRAFTSRTSTFRDRRDHKSRRRSRDGRRRKDDGRRRPHHGRFPSDSSLEGQAIRKRTSGECSQGFRLLDYFSYLLLLTFCNLDLF